MLILDKPRVLREGFLSIPLYHRGHLSLFPGATVKMCLLPQARSAAEERVMSELILSPVNFDSWGDLWRIRLTLAERPGVVNSVFQVLQEEGVSILAAESSSMEWQSLHSVEVLADASRYASWEDGTSEQRSSGEIEELRSLRRSLIVRLFEDIWQPNGPRVKIQRVRNLFDARQWYFEAKADGAARRALPVINETIMVRHPELDRLGVYLPKDVLVELQTALEDRHPKYLLVSETTDRFLRAFFIRGDTPILSPTILHKDSVGVLAAITEVLKDYEFDIITALSRLYEHGTKARTELVLRSMDETLNEEALRQRLCEALGEPSLAGFGVQLGFQVGYASTLKAEEVIKQTRESKTDGPGRPRLSFEEHLEQLYQSSLRKALIDPSHHPSFSYLAALREEWRLIHDDPDSKQRTPLFISYAFQDKDRLQRIKNSARQRGFYVITGEELGPARRSRDGVIRLIDMASHFLGVWSDEGGIETLDGKSWPSPWLLWELGVADALDKRWQLLISEQVHKDAWRKLAGETPHVEYGLANFDKKIKTALNYLKNGG